MSTFFINAITSSPDAYMSGFFLAALCFFTCFIPALGCYLISRITLAASD